MTTFNLSEPTVFPDRNKKENKEPTFAHTSLNLQQIKYKHFRSVAKYPEADQLHHLMLAVTELSEDDLGELSPVDTAEIAKYILGSMKAYMQLGKQVMHDMQ